MKQFTNLSLKDRKRIEILIIGNLSASIIAKQLGLHRSTITREIQRNSLPCNIYSADFAEKRVKKKQKKRLKKK